MDAERLRHVLLTEDAAACSFDPARMLVGAGGWCVRSSQFGHLPRPTNCSSRTVLWCIRFTSGFVETEFESRQALIVSPGFLPAFCRSQTTIDEVVPSCLKSSPGRSANVCSSSDRLSIHIPVMPREVLRSLQLSQGLTVLDGTVGGGSHSSLILKQIGPTGRLIAMDRDPMMLHLAQQRLDSENTNRTEVHFRRGSYLQAASVLDELNITTVDRVFLDLGLSSDQLADRHRGFGFDAGGPLDMRFNPQEGVPASQILQTYSEEELTELFKTFGEEPAAGRIAAEIVRRRQQHQAISTAEQLEDCVRRATGIHRTGAGRNPATRVFQALRIAANQELQHVEQMILDVLPQILNQGGIAVVLTFHSLEDRIVKTAFKGQQGWQILTKTPIEATPAEIRLNPRSRSARLRSAQRV